MKTPNGNRSNWSVFAAVGAAIGASTCCTVPLALVSMGVGGAWMGHLMALTPYRPMFVLGAVGLMGFAVVRSIRADRDADCDCEDGVRPLRRNLLLGIGMVATLGLIVSPWLLPEATQGASAPSASENAGFSEAVLRIEGMTCPSCATTVTAALSRIDGVLYTKVTDAPPLAVVQYDQSRTEVTDMISAIENVGFQAGPVQKSTDEHSHLDHDTEAMPPLKLDELRTSFNSSQDDVRLLAILSPTCGECIEGHEVIRKLFERHDSNRLRAMIVWLPMRPGDHAGAAAEQAKIFEDDRLILEGWDSAREIGAAFEKTLDLSRTAWDVYLVYESGITWSDELPPKPSYWMHQLTEDAGANRDYCLNPVILDSEVAKRLETTQG